jgi:hypothetical protein
LRISSAERPQNRRKHCLAARILSKDQSQFLKLDVTMARVVHEPSDIFDEEDLINHGCVSPAR